ncbi:MAG: hypothetical protein CMH79_03935 [Nitrospinae bacterium]|nr:hypothetical protein [Nitrospinota bacterium]
MNTEETKTVETKVTKENIDLDTIFNPAPTADAIVTAEDSKPGFFEREAKVDIDAIAAEPTDVAAQVEPEEPAETEVDNLVAATDPKAATGTETPKSEATEALNALDELAGVNDDDAELEEKVETRGRKKISGISDVFNKLIKEDKIIPFDDEKSLEEYTAKDWEELISANLEEKAAEVRRETPQKFFESLPQELQIAARYVADGGQDLKGLFSALSQVEESRDLNLSNERDQERIITEYLGATGFGSSEEIREEIEVWKDLGKLKQQASKFKPKLDKMQESVVARKLEEQQMKQQQQQQASQQYMENVYNTLKEGALGDIKMDKKTQAMLYNGLVQPTYPSISGRNTNLLGHLLEKYQFVEPNYQIISEALWLLQDPAGYKAKIMEKGATKSVENTVRKLKTEQSNRAGTSLGVGEGQQEAKPKRKIPRGNNIFKRF